MLSPLFARRLGGRCLHTKVELLPEIKEKTVHALMLSQGKCQSRAASQSKANKVNLVAGVAGEETGVDRVHLNGVCWLRVTVREVRQGEAEGCEQRDRASGTVCNTAEAIIASMFLIPTLRQLMRACGSLWSAGGGRGCKWWQIACGADRPCRAHCPWP